MEITLNSNTGSSVNTGDLPIINQAKTRKNRVVIISNNNKFTYKDLLSFSKRGASCLLNGADDLKEQRVAFLVPSTIDYVVAQWSIWRAGGAAVPLCTSHPIPELEYTITDSKASILIAHKDFKERLAPIAQKYNLRLVLVGELWAHETTKLPVIQNSRKAMLLYTSGTTSKPKGVVFTHTTIEAQITALIEAWGWSEDDHILHVLPLHHIHGIINILCCAMWAGAICEFLPKFDADKVWQRIEASSEQDGLSLFMAVPTIYSRLTSCFDKADKKRQQSMSAGCKNLRLMVCGSAALPVPMLDSWEKISGHTLLERYGMTEIGMALSNPLEGTRRPGFVGQPLPGMEVRLVDEENNIVSEDKKPGEIQVKGPAVFSEYWDKPEATKKAFTNDSWFHTGDIAVREDGAHRILGRDSIDIIKTGGYKVSALEIESVLKTHSDIKECAVVGVEDSQWGQRVAAALVLFGNKNLELKDLRDWGKQRLAHYKVPTLLKIVDKLPRNAMGKVTKPNIVKMFDR